MSGWNEEYELVGLIQDDGIRTHQARQRNNGAEVYLHLFVRRAQNDLTLYDQLAARQQQGDAQLLASGRFGEVPYVVTPPWGFAPGFRTWARQLLAQPSEETVTMQPAAVPLPPPVPPVDPTPALGRSSLPEEPDEFSRLFSQPLGQSGPAAEVSPAGEFTQRFIAAQPLLEKLPEPVPAASGQGEFTRMFAATGKSALPSTQHVAPGGGTPLATPSTTAAQSAGEFTRFFGAPLVRPAETDAPPDTPGDFTNLFSAPVGPTDAPLAAVVPPPRSAAPVEAAHGEFTKFFQSPLTPAPLPSYPVAPVTELPVFPAAPRPEPGEYTKLFGGAQQGSGAAAPGGLNATQSFAAPAAAESAPPPPAPGLSGAAGDYTQMMASPVLPPPVAAPGPAAAPTKPQPPLVPLIIGGVILVLLAVAAFLLLAGK